MTLERQTRPRTARVKRQRKNRSANNKLAVTVGTVGALPNIIVIELPNVNIPKNANHPSILGSLRLVGIGSDLDLFCCLFTLDRSNRRMAEPNERIKASGMPA